MRTPTTNPWRTRGAGPLILGHRGARQRAVENTLGAFELAVAEGADGVELDARLNQDHEVVVLHDRTLERVTDGADSRDIEELRNAELDTLCLPGGARIPRLQEVLDWATTAGVRVNVELKPDVSRREELVRRVAAMVRKVTTARELVLLSSLHPSVLAQLHQRAPGIQLGWVIAPELAPLWGEPLWPGLGPVAPHPHESLATRARVAAAHRRGAPLNVWTVNDPDRARELVALGVDAIITDDPAGIVAALSPAGPEDDPGAP